MKNENHNEEYEFFYMELPQADYLNDIEIQDEYDDPNDKIQGLSAEQVSEIARDSLDAAGQQSPQLDPKEPNLFSDDHSS